MLLLNLESDSLEDTRLPESVLFYHIVIVYVHH